MNNGKLRASIDFGTNTARLLVAEIRLDGTFKHVLIEREIVRMGGGFTRDAGLSEEAFQRGLRCLQRFADILGKYDVSSVRAVATSAVRDAANGQAFIDTVQLQTGIRLVVIDGEREGELTLAGVTAGLDSSPDDLLVFDIGGGSTEYTLAQNGHPSFIRSLPLGVVRLTEGKSTTTEMLDKITRELNILKDEMTRSGVAIQPERSLLVGTAGTATTLAAIRLEMDDYDYRRVNNSWLTLDEIRSIYDRLLPLTPEQRVAIPGLEKGREDLIIAGTLLTIETMQQFGFSSMKVSDYGLLEGLIVADEF